MRPFIVLPVLALLTNAAVLLQHSLNLRQLHNADFSSSPPVGPAAKANTGSFRSFDPASARRQLAQPRISILASSNSGAQSVSVANGGATVQARAETGSDPDIDPPEAPVDENTIVSRQVDDADPSSDDVLATRADPADPVVSRDINLVTPLFSGNNPQASTPDAAQMVCNLVRMLSADKSVNVPMPGTVTAASGGARNPLARRSPLTATIGSATTTLNCVSAAGVPIQNFVVDSSAFPSIGIFSRNDNVDVPALPVTPAVSLPIRSERRVSLNSPRNHLTRSDAPALPALPVPVPVPALPSLPSLPVPRRDTSLNAAVPPINAGAISARVFSQEERL